ncbi:MAG: hypothetical protein AAGA32_08730 [Pseudomonadota bacterium]
MRTSAGADQSKRPALAAALVFCVAAALLGALLGLWAVAALLVGTTATLGLLVSRLLVERGQDRARLVDLEAQAATVAKRAAEASALGARLSALEAQAVLPEPAEPPVLEVETEPELPMLALDEPVELSNTQVVRALNFPADAGDAAGFDILRRALARPDLAQLLQAAEDCLNFLAEEGLYADDLLVAQASASDWRTFAKGGAARAALMPIQGIHDTGATTAVHARMRTDAVFRDAALVFQRRFDSFLSRFAPMAEDREVLDLMDTRSGRAFILFAQVSGTLS